MKLYIELKEMTFEDGIEHSIINGIRDEEFAGYDKKIELSDNNKFIKDTLKIEYEKDKDGNDTDEIKNRFFIIKEQETWWNYPLYEFKNGKIINFDYTKYQYFANCERRAMLGEKINHSYNSSSEIKILRKTLKHIMNTLEMSYPKDFEKYNKKIEALIAKNPKD